VSRTTLSLGAALALSLVCASARADAAELDVSGSLRGRYETLAGQFRPGVSRSDQLVSFRVGVAAELDLSPLTLGAELLDSRGYFVDEGGTFGPGDVNAVEPLQVYARLKAGATQWTVGRFTQDLGSRRVISRSRSGNTTNAFSGVRGVWTGQEGESLTGLYVMPLIRHPTDPAKTLRNAVALDDETWDYRFYGAFYTSRPFAGGVRADAYVFHLSDEDGGRRAVRDRHITTAGARLFRTPKAGALDFEVEGMWQTGTARASGSVRDLRDLDVSAGYLHAEVGWSFDGPWRPRLELAYDYGSGDKDPTDGDYGRFDSLFGSRRGDFGPGGLYGPLSRSNLVAPVLRVEVAPGDRWEGYVSGRPLWLAQKRDSFASTGVQDPTGQSGRFAGYQVEGRVRRKLGQALVWETGGGWLVPQGFLEHAPNATHEGSTRYAYSDITMSF
jgi:hypothetical protein